MFLNTHCTNGTNLEKFLNQPDANLNSMLIEASESPPEDSENSEGVFLYTILQGQEKTMQTIHKPYIQPYISLIFRALIG